MSVSDSSWQCWLAAGGRTSRKTSGLAARLEPFSDLPTPSFSFQDKKDKKKDKKDKKDKKEDKKEKVKEVVLSEEGELCYKYRKDVKKALTLRKKEKDGEKRDMVKFQVGLGFRRFEPLLLLISAPAPP